MVQILLPSRGTVSGPPPHHTLTHAHTLTGYSLWTTPTPLTHTCPHPHTTHTSQGTVSGPPPHHSHHSHTHAHTLTPHTPSQGTVSGPPSHSHTLTHTWPTPSHHTHPHRAQSLDRPHSLLNKFAGSIKSLANSGCHFQVPTPSPWNKATRGL